MAEVQQASHNCRRGIFGIHGWKELARKAKESPPPTVIAKYKSSRGSTPVAEVKPNSSHSASQVNTEHKTSPQPQKTTESRQTTESQQTNKEAEQEVQAPRPGRQIMAKYKYQANADSPLGLELSLVQSEKLTMKGLHPENVHWWRAVDKNGLEGYVPATYMMVVEEKVTSLPWLKNKPVEEEKPEEQNASGPFKPYQSAYNRAGEAKQGEKKYYCDICEKSLNGPQPYNAHMASKAHREEVEIRKDFDN